MKKVKQVTVVFLISISAFLGNGCLNGNNCDLVDNLDLEVLTLADGAIGEYLFFVPSLVFPDSLEYGDEFVINNDSVYQAWETAAGNCEGCVFPDIDFNQKTLIGKYYRLDCGEYPLLYVTKDGNVYTHYTKSIDDSLCETSSCQNFTFGWVSVPKIDAGATVEFVYGESYYDCNC